jgi:hypothetical protein
MRHIQHKFHVGQRVLYGSGLCVISMIGIRCSDGMPMYNFHRSSEWIPETELN